MTTNRRNINELRYLTRNSLIISNNLDILKIEPLPVRRSAFLRPDGSKPAKLERPLA